MITKFGCLMLAIICLISWLFVGCAKPINFKGTDCDSMYNSCVERCRLYGDAPQGQRDLWAGTGGNCFYKCETNLRNCRKQN